MTYNNGFKYEGMWSNDKYNGQGTLIDRYGNQFVGNWHSGMKHG